MDNIFLETLHSAKTILVHLEFKIFFFIQNQTIIFIIIATALIVAVTSDSKSLEKLNIRKLKQ